MRKEGPMIVTVLSSLVVLFSNYFFLGQQWGLTDRLDYWFNISYGIALALGFVNLTIIHWKYVQRRREGWVYSVILLLVMYGYLLLGIVEQHTGPTFSWIYDNMMTVLGAAVFSLLAFLISSAAYRAFRIRTKEATILLVCAIFILLARAPIGDAIWSRWSYWGNEWFMGVLNTAGYRGILLGAYVGAFAVALRILLGLERAHLGGTGTQ